MMKIQEFIEIAAKIAKEPTKYYSVPGGSWASWVNNKWNFDCVILIKAILWGFNFNKQVVHGGAKYLSNNVPDYAANQLFNECCYDKSNDFTNISIGELVWLDGHVGIYIGDGKVIEATSAWEGGVLISNILNDGTRTKNNHQVYKWTSHGKCKYIEYPQELKYKVGDNVIINGNLYVSSNADNPVGSVTDKVTNITRVSEGSKHPYNTTNDLGWMSEDSIKMYEEPQIDYEQLYKQELLKNKDLQKQVENLQNKINKALEDLQ